MAVSTVAHPAAEARLRQCARGKGDGVPGAAAAAGVVHVLCMWVDVCAFWVRISACACWVCISLCACVVRLCVVNVCLNTCDDVVCVRSIVCECILVVCLGGASDCFIMC